MIHGQKNNKVKGIF